MLKKLDQYIIKTFFGPFLFIFSVLFFIFMVNIVWIQLSQFTGKGLNNWEIVKFLFYLSVNVVKMVLPLTILLASIMTFGDFGERYELAAMKSAGISLTRIMTPLFVVVSLLSIMLFVFSNNVIPDFQRKAKNMMYNIAATKPAINFTARQDGMKELKKLDGVSEDIIKDTEAKIQELTDKYVKLADEHLKAKEADIFKI